MNWKEIKNNIYHWDGSWLDIYIHKTDYHDWGKWVDFVNSNFKIDWYNGKTESDEKKIDFEVIKEYWNGKHDYCSTAKVFIDKIQINAHFFDSSEIKNDIDPREFNSIDDHERLIDFMINLSKTLGKSVY